MDYIKVDFLIVMCYSNYARCCYWRKLDMGLLCIFLTTSQKSTFPSEKLI